MTALYSRSDLESLLDVRACIDALDKGFRARPSGIAAQRVRTDLPGPGTATALIPGLLDGIPAYTVKVNAKFPGATPALRGVVCLHDLSTGELLALLDSATITAWRTCLAAALATHTLADPSATTIAVIGAGAQADLVMRGLSVLRPALTDLYVHDVDPSRAEAFAARHNGQVMASLDVHDIDIVLLATWARTPILDVADVTPGTHLTSLGADEPGKAELSPALLRSSRLIVDDLPLALTSGALGTAALPTEAAAGTLTQVLTAEIPAHLPKTTIYSPVGLPWQDLALSWQAHTQSPTTHTFNFL